MESALYDEQFQTIKRDVKKFFSGQHISDENLQEAIDNKDVLTTASDIRPYLQSTLLDEKIIEVEIDDLSRVYFTRLYDDYPPLVMDEEGNVIEPEYTPADYLKQSQYILTLPLEPGLGNLAARRSSKILIRIFTTSYAVELGTYFESIAEVRDVRVLRFGYPVIGLIVRGARSFRAKVPKTMDISTHITPPKGKQSYDASITDVSAKEMTFGVGKDLEEALAIDQTITIQIVVDGVIIVKLNGTIRHISKVRGKGGTEKLCGVQFDLESRAIASKIERIVSQVQREHLREISGLAEESGLDLIA